MLSALYLLLTLAAAGALLALLRWPEHARAGVVWGLAALLPLLAALAGALAGQARAARTLAAYLSRAGYKLSQPLGYQEELWWAMQPGVPANRAVREFAQITTSRALACAVPLASTELPR